MKILITGGDGFIARNLFEQLNNAYTVIAPDSKALNLLDSSKVCEYIKTGRFDVIIHAATYDAAPKHSIKDRSKVLENNLRMFFNIARCKNYFDKMIYFGSGAEFDREHWTPKMSEACFDRHVPADQYGYSKYLMTRYALAGNSIFNVRLFGVFGKYDDWRTRFIPNACCHAVLGLPIRIDQNRFCDYLYTDDLVKVIRWFIAGAPKQQVYNVCSGQSMESRSIAETIIKLSGKQPGSDLKATELGPEYSGNNALLLAEMGGFEFTPFEAALRQLYAWYADNTDLIDKTQL